MDDKFYFINQEKSFKNLFPHFLMLYAIEDKLYIQELSFHCE